VANSIRGLRADAISIFRAGLEAARAGEAVRRNVKPRRSKLDIGSDCSISVRDFQRIYVIGAGKAGAEMAAALEQQLGTQHIEDGVICVKYGHVHPKSKKIRLVECGHPIPDAAGQKGAEEIEALLRSLTGRDLVFVLISGGASALMPAPPSDISLKDKQKTTSVLLKAGADIFELNTVRKHLSNLKGGRLAALAYPATVIGLVLSDVIGDRLDVIGSGLTAPDQSTFGDALRVLAKHSATTQVPRSVLAHLLSGAKGHVPETPKPGDFIFSSVHNVIIGSNRLALRAAANRAEELGYKALILSSSIQGETKEVARVHCEILREVVANGSPIGSPACLLSGGETTVTVRGRGKGGRNQEFALAAAIALADFDKAIALSAGTDGTDGPTDAAGGIADSTSEARASKLGVDLRKSLGANDSYTALAKLGDLLKTGPTGTNVMDLHILLA
jgi:glycerate 2-kinase